MTWAIIIVSNAFDERNAQLLGDELREEVRKAEEEWKQIDRDLLKWFGAELGSGLLAAGPLLSMGQGAFLAAAFAVAGTLTITATTAQRNAFPEKFPAAFFMNLK